MPSPEKITAALVAAMMHSDEPMVLSDPRAPDHPMIAINPAFERLTQYPAAETVGRNCRFLQGAETDPNTRARLRGHLMAGRGCVEWIVNYRRDGSKFWNLLFLSPVFSHDGVLLHYFGNQRDISEGPPVGLPDYSIGRAEMTGEGKSAFSGLLLDLLEGADEGDGRAAGLERLVTAARALDRATTALAPAKWEMP